MTTVACVWVRGNVPFPVQYVTRLASMVKRWMDRPYRFAVLTDRPHLVPRGLDRIFVERPVGIYGWWTKVSLFSSAMPFTGRVLYLDLDTLVVAPLRPIVDFPAQFALIPDAGNFQGTKGRTVVKRFNSSVMVWDAGVNRRLFDDWDRSVTKRLHGDQDWIGEQYPDAAQMPLSWFPRVSELGDEPPSKEAKVVLVKVPKNIEAAQRYPWVAEAWA